MCIKTTFSAHTRASLPFPPLFRSGARCLGGGYQEGLPQPRADDTSGQTLIPRAARGEKRVWHPTSSIVEPSALFPKQSVPTTLTVHTAQVNKTNKTFTLSQPPNTAQLALPPHARPTRLETSSTYTPSHTSPLSLFHLHPFSLFPLPRCLPMMTPGCLEELQQAARGVRGVER